MSIIPGHEQGSSFVIHEEGQCCTIMVVDDDEAMRNLLVDELSEYGCRVVQAANGSEAMSHLHDVVPSVVVTDLHMKSGGFDFVKQMKVLVPGCRVVVVTAFGDAQTQSQAKEVGVDGYFDKPVRMGDLKSLVKVICPQRECPHVQRDQTQ